MTDDRDAATRGESKGTGRIDRRQFLRRSALTGAGLALAASQSRAEEASPDGLPMRTLGRTKARVTILGLGTAPLGEGPVGVQEGIKVFGTVLDRGVNYVDTARIYGNAEEILGHLVPKRRDKLFLVTKVSTDSAKRAEQSLAESLRLLKTDYLDLVHIHSVGSKNIDKVLASDGVLNYLLKLKDKGTLRFIGISGHNRPPRFVRLLKTGQIDVVMPVLNYADRNVYDFESKVLPEARKQKAGIVAMKVYVGIKGGFKFHKKGHVGCATRAELLPQAMAYALGLEDIATAVIGPYTLEQAIQNVKLAAQYKPLTDAQRDTLLTEGKTLAEKIGPRYGPVE